MSVEGNDGAEEVHEDMAGGVKTELSSRRQGHRAALNPGTLNLSESREGEGLREGEQAGTVCGQGSVLGGREDAHSAGQSRPRSKIAELSMNSLSL